MCAMYCSSFLSDISYCIVLIMKMQKGEVLVTVMDLLMDREFLFLLIEKDTRNGLVCRKHPTGASGFKNCRW